MYETENQVIANDSLKDDKFELSSSDVHLEVVGFTDKARFDAAPVLYGDLKERLELMIKN